MRGKIYFMKREEIYKFQNERVCKGESVKSGQVCEI